MSSASSYTRHKNLAILFKIKSIKESRQIVIAVFIANTSKLSNSKRIKITYKNSLTFRESRAFKSRTDRMQEGSWKVTFWGRAPLRKVALGSNVLQSACWRRRSFGTPCFVSSLASCPKTKTRVNVTWRNLTWRHHTENAMNGTEQIRGWLFLIGKGLRGSYHAVRSRMIRVGRSCSHDATKHTCS